MTAENTEKILRLLDENSRLTPEEIAIMLGMDAADVAAEIKRLEKEKTIVAYKALIDWDKTGNEIVDALIELKVTPQRDEGFDSIAEKIYTFDEVKSVYLMSGGFDLMVSVEGKSMKEVALFVAERLSPMESILSTATHFVLRKYKQEGVILEDGGHDERRMITL